MKTIYRRFYCTSSIFIAENVDSAEDSTWSIGDTSSLFCDIDETVQEWIFGGSKINQTEDFLIHKNILSVRNVRSAYAGIYICRGMTKRRLFRVVVQGKLNVTFNSKTI